eukprot:scaffold7428_cov153-Amphora_coffeaeformis.AAC.12
MIRKGGMISNKAPTFQVKKGRQEPLIPTVLSIYRIYLYPSNNQKGRNVGRLYQYTGMETMTPQRMAEDDYMDITVTAPWRVCMVYVEPGRKLP